MSKYTYIQLTNTPNDNEASEWGCVNLLDGSVITEKECRIMTNGIQPVALGGSLGIYTQVPSLNASDLNPQTSFEVNSEVTNTGSERDIIDYSESQVPDSFNIQPKVSSVDSVSVGGFNIIKGEEEKPFYKTIPFYILGGILVIILGWVIFKAIKKK